MIEEFPILDRNQRFHQIRRHLIQLDQDAILVVRRIQSTNQHGLQTRHRQSVPVGAAEASNEIAGEADPQPLRLLGAFVELEAAGVQFDVVAGNRSAARR